MVAFRFYTRWELGEIVVDNDICHRRSRRRSYQSAASTRIGRRQSQLQCRRPSPGCTPARAAAHAGSDLLWTRINPDRRSSSMRKRTRYGDDAIRVRRDKHGRVRYEPTSQAPTMERRFILFAAYVLEQL